MKTKEEIFDSLMPVSLTKEGFIQIIEEAQKEAWNEAIEAAAESATTNLKGYASCILDSPCVDKQSILKLKK